MGTEAMTDPAQAQASTETPLAPPEQLETKPAAGSPPSEIEKTLATLRDEQQRLRREHAEELATLHAEIEQERTSRRQALEDRDASMLARIQERTTAETRALDDLVAEELMTREERDARVMRAQQRITGEETRKYREGQVLSQRQLQEQERQKTEKTMQGLLNASGLVDGDPELETVPLQIDARYAPADVVKFFTAQVDAAKSKKAARVDQENKARLAQAQAQAVHVELGGGGGGAAARTADQVSAEIMAESNKPHPDYARLDSLGKELDKFI